MKVTATTEGLGPLKLSLEVDCGGTAPGPDPPPPTGGTFELNGDLAGITLLTHDSGWYTRVDALPVHSRSSAIVMAQPILYAPTGHRFKNDWGPEEGIPYAVGRGFPAVPVNVYLYPGESDLGPRPIPLDAPIEAGSDHHLIYLDRDAGFLYEFGMAEREGTGFKCEAAAAWNIHKSYDQRPLGHTSADAAGLPMLPGLVRYDEMKRALSVPDGDLGHALRFTLPNTGHGFIDPARHYASIVPYALPARPPMGMRIRLKPDMDLTPFNPPTRVLFRTLQRYGAILADNGAAFFITGTHDVRWGEYWDAITGQTDEGRGFKSMGGTEFLGNIQVLNWEEGAVYTQL